MSSLILKRMCLLAMIIMLNTFGLTTAQKAASAEIPTVTVDAEKLDLMKEAKTVKKRLIRSVDGELHIHLRNLLTKSQPINLKFTGLAAEYYGVYNDGSYVGNFTKQDLEAGIKITLPEFTLPEWYTTYIAEVHNNAAKAKKLFTSRIPPDAAVCYDALSDTEKYTEQMLRPIEAWRSANLILTPNDSIVKMADKHTRPAPDEQMKLVLNNMEYISRVRYTINNKTKPGEIRNIALSAITPIALSCSMPKSTPPGFKFVTKLAVTNRTNLPINAEPVFTGTSGWVFKPKKSGVILNLAPQQTAVLEYWTAVPKDITPSKPKVFLNVRIVGSELKFTHVPLPEPKVSKEVENNTI